MEVEANVRSVLLKSSDLIGHKHELVSMDPDGLRVDCLACVVHTSGHLDVDSLELRPIVQGYLLMVT